jgi:hypothetical protein
MNGTLKVIMFAFRLMLWRHRQVVWVLTMCSCVAPSFPWATTSTKSFILGFSPEGPTNCFFIFLTLFALWLYLPSLKLEYLEVTFSKLVSLKNFLEFTLWFYISVIRAIKVLAAIRKVGRGSSLEEVLLEHATFNFRITPNLQKWRKSSNSLIGQEYMWNIPTSQLSSIWASEGKKKWGEYKHKLGVLL